MAGTTADRRAELADRVRLVMDDVEEMRFFDGTSTHDIDWIRAHADRAMTAAQTGTLATE